MINDKKIHVLLIEDDPDDYCIIRRQLVEASQRFELTWKQSLGEAVRFLQEKRADVILSDLSLSDGLGFETISRLRETSGSLPIVVLTSLDDEELEQRLIVYGAQDYLIKGEITPRAASRAILHALQRQQALNEIAGLVDLLEDNRAQLRKQSEELQANNSRLQQLLNTAQEFVDNVSHDFRTPLTVIKDYVSLMREGLVGEVSEQQQQMLDKVLVRADDLNNMVDDLLDVSKMDAGLINFWRRPCRLSEISQRVIPMLRQRAAVRNTNLIVESPHEDCELFCDAEKAGRVLTNIAVNAIKAAGENGEVRIWFKTNAEEACVEVGVTDNGPGIDPEVLDRVFGRFEQANESTRHSAGTGLGLSIAKELTRLNLGQLNCQSAVGEGATFSFTLPTFDQQKLVDTWIISQQATDHPGYVLEFQLAETARSDEIDDFDIFLSCVVKANDLLLPAQNARWVILLDASTDNLDSWLQRAEREWEHNNRNRPDGSLPAYRLEVICDWKPGIQTDLLQTSICNAVFDESGAKELAYH